MELAFVIWAVGTLPSIASGLCAMFGFLALIGFLVFFITKIVSVCNGHESDREDAANVSKVLKFPTIMFSILWILMLLIPDKQTAYQMFAAYGVQSLVENQQAQKLASDGVDVIKALLARAKKELEEPVKN